MAGSRRVVIEFLGKDKTASSTARSVDRSTSKIGANFAKVGKMAAVGMAVAGTAVVAGGKYFFSLGAKLEQMGMKAETVFGNQLGSVEKWSKANSAAMGLTSREATGLAANFADLLIPMGFTRKAAAGMSTDVVGLSGALSQWTGGTRSAAEVSDILAKAMLGERDGLKELGISILDADVKARLLKNGTDKLTGSALQQAQAQATQQLIMEKSTDAQAAFAAGGSPLLTAQNLLKAKFGEVRDTIAVKLIPIFTKLAAWFVTEGLPAISAFGGWIRDNLFPIFESMRAVVAKVFGSMSGQVGGNMGKIQQIIRDVTVIIRALWARFGDGLVQSIRIAFKLIKSVIGPALKIIGGIVKVFAGILTGDWRKVWSGVKDILSGALKLIIAIVRGAFGILKVLIREAWGVVKDIVRGAWDGIKDIVRAGADRLLDTIRNIPERLRNLGGVFASAGRSLINAFVDGLKNAAGVIGGIAGNVWSAVKSLLNAAIGKINAALSFTISLPGPDLSINTPDIPYLAKGGIVTRPTLAVLGEAGPEAVIPLTGRNAPAAQSNGTVAKFELNLHLDGKKIQTSLLTLKRRNGGLTLGLT